MLRLVPTLMMVVVLCGCGDVTTPDDPTPGVEASALSPERTAELLAEIEDGELREPLQPEASWRKRVETALRTAGFGRDPRVHAARTQGGTLDVVETRAERADDAWVRIERFDGGAPVLAERAALYVTPRDHRFAKVVPIDLGGFIAYRSTFDDPDHPTIAWLHGGLFVQTDMDRGRAGGLHRALGDAGAYAVHDGAAKRGGSLGLADLEEADGPPHESESDELVVGRWKVRESFTFTVEADGTWTTRRTKDGKTVASGTWRALELGSRYVFTSGTSDSSPVKGWISVDGVLHIEDEGSTFQARRISKTPASRFGPTLDGTGERPLEESFGESEGLSDAPFETPATPATPARVAPPRVTPGILAKARDVMKPIRDEYEAAKDLYDVAQALKRQGDHERSRASLRQANAHMGAVQELWNEVIMTMPSNEDWDEEETANHWLPEYAKIGDIEALRAKVREQLRSR